MIFYCIYSFSIKFLMLPQLLSKTAGADCWLAALFGTVIELLVLWVALTILSRTKTPQGKSPASYLSHTLMLALFLLQLFILINQAFGLLNDNLFDEISVQGFIIPMLLLGVFFCFMPTRAVFRSGEIFFVFIIIGIALSVFPALTNINPKEVLPIFGQGAKSVHAMYVNLIYFESASMLLIFNGQIKIEKHFRKKFMTLATVLGAFFVFFVFMFYSLFGPLAPFKGNAVSNLTLYSSYITNSGRLDWVLITIWLLLLLLRFGITFFCAYSCIKNITSIKNRAGILSCMIAIFVYFISVFLFPSGRHLNRFIETVPWLIAGLYAAVPALFLLNKRRLECSGLSGAKKH